MYIRQRDFYKYIQSLVQQYDVCFFFLLLSSLWRVSLSSFASLPLCQHKPDTYLDWLLLCSFGFCSLMIVQPPFSSLTLLSYLLTSSQETKPTSWLVCSTWRKYGNRLLLPSSNDVYKGCLPYQRFFFCYHHTKAENIFPFNFVLKKMKFSIEKINRQTPVKRRGPSTQRSKSCPPFSIKSLNVNQVVLPSYNPPFITIIRLFLQSFTRKKYLLSFTRLPNGQKYMAQGPHFLSPTTSCVPDT